MRLLTCVGALTLAASGWAQVPPPAPAITPAQPAQAILIDPANGQAPILVDPANAPHAVQLQLELQAKVLADAAIAAQVAGADAQAAVADAQTVLVQAQGGLMRDGQQVFAFGGRQPKTEKAAFLGVASVPADPAIRDQLKLPRGVGVVIQQVTEDSPASRAGIQEHDILMKLDDQWLVNSQQFGVVVRMHKPGDEVKVTLVRQGQQQTVTAKLEEKEMVIPENNEPFMANGQVLSAPVPMVPDVKDWVKNFDNNDDADMIIKDNDHTLKIRVKNGEKHLVATDDNGQVVFDGPIQTDEQKKAVPAEVAEKLEKYKDQIDKLKENAPGEQRKIRIIKDGR
jgi:hypothetical protein